MVRMFRRSNGKLYLEYEAYGKIVQKSTRLDDTPKNRNLIKKEVIPALERKILKGDFQKDKPKKFSYYADIYLRDKKHLKSYDRLQKHIKIINDTFGDMYIDEINRSHIKSWINFKLKELTPKTVRNYLSSISGVMLVAMDYEAIKDNVVKDIKLPQHHAKEVEPFTQIEVQKLLDNANDFYRSYLAIAFYTGMRRGEILGLMYSDIDFDNMCIYVKRSISEGKITTPKTTKSIRTVPILNDLLPYLNKPKKSLWMFSNDDGTPIKHFGGAKKRQWRILLEACNIEYRKLYTTRHTFIVSMLKYSGLSILEIAQIVGHTTTQMIIQHYGKYIKGEHLKIDRNIKLFTDNSTDTKVKSL